MHHIQQPIGSKLCGQACIAMLLDVSLSKAIGLVGHVGGTVTEELIAAIRKGGRQCDNELKTGRPRGTCLVKLNRRGKRSGSWHWVVYDRGEWHDPAFMYSDHVSDGDPTSYLMVF